eukprot:2985723-Rhodomonas_salina.2
MVLLDGPLSPVPAPCRRGIRAMELVRIPPLLLCICYEMSGTDVGHAAPRWAKGEGWREERAILIRAAR